VPGFSNPVKLLKKKQSGSQCFALLTADPLFFRRITLFFNGYSRKMEKLLFQRRIIYSQRFLICASRFLIQKKAAAMFNMLNGIIIAPDGFYLQHF